MVMQVELDKLKFFARPKLGLDCVGGASTLRLSDALAQVIPLLAHAGKMLPCASIPASAACMLRLHELTQYVRPLHEQKHCWPIK